MSVPTVPEIISELGGASALARRLGVSRQAVSMWGRRGFPRDIDTVLRLEAVFRESGIQIKPYLAKPAPPRPAPAEGAAA